MGEVAEVAAAVEDDGEPMRDPAEVVGKGGARARLGSALLLAKVRAKRTWHKLFKVTDDNDETHEFVASKEKSKTWDTVTLAMLYPLARLHYAIAVRRPNVFLRMLDGRMPNKFIHEDKILVAMKDIAPVAEHHLLLVPREHIHSWPYLRRDHLGLLKHMRRVGLKLLTDQGLDEDAEVRFFFMTPPYNSQMQLHLHCVSQPMTPTSLFDRIRVRTMESRKAIDLDDLIERLEILYGATHKERVSLASSRAGRDRRGSAASIKSMSSRNSRSSSAS